MEEKKPIKMPDKMPPRFDRKKPSLVDQTAGAINSVVSAPGKPLAPPAAGRPAPGSPAPAPRPSAPPSQPAPSAPRPAPKSNYPPQPTAGRPPVPPAQTGEAAGGMASNPIINFNFAPGATPPIQR
jgi:hypothetical protein